MVITGIIVIGVIAYAIWAIRKSAGAVKTVLAAAGVVLDALEKNIAVNKFVRSRCF